MLTLTLADFEEVRARIAPHIKHTPLLTSRQLSERTGYDVRLKAEMFQRVGSYKIRGPLNKFALMPEEQKRRGVVCSSAGNHAQGVALAAKIHGIRAVVCMADERDAGQDRGDARATAPRSCCTAPSGTRPTRRRRSSCAPRASPTSIRSTTSS